MAAVQLHSWLSTLWWIIRKSSALSYCVSFTRRWPRLRLPPARHNQIWNVHNPLNMAAGAIGVIVLALARTPHQPSVHKLLWSVDRRMNEVEFRRVVEEEDGRMEEGESEHLQWQ